MVPFLAIRDDNPPWIYQWINDRKIENWILNRNPNIGNLWYLYIFMAIYPIVTIVIDFQENMDSLNMLGIFCMTHSHRATFPDTTGFPAKQIWSTLPWVHGRWLASVVSNLLLIEITTISRLGYKWCWNVEIWMVVTVQMVAISINITLTLRYATMNVDGLYKPTNVSLRSTNVGWESRNQHSITQVGLHFDEEDSSHVEFNTQKQGNTTAEVPSSFISRSYGSHGP